MLSYTRWRCAHRCASPRSNLHTCLTHIGASHSNVDSRVRPPQGWLLRRVLPAPRFRGTLVEPRLYVGSLEDAHRCGGQHLFQQLYSGTPWWHACFFLRHGGLNCLSGLLCSVCDLQERRIRSVLTAAAEPTGLQPIPLPSEDFR